MNYKKLIQDSYYLTNFYTGEKTYQKPKTMA